MDADASPRARTRRRARPTRDVPAHRGRGRGGWRRGTAAPRPDLIISTFVRHNRAVNLPSSHPLVDGRTTHSSLVRAYSGERPERRPVWFMRQAGRSLPEYRAARDGTAMLDACLDPALASEITLQPVRRHDVDAAIFFSDIVVPLKLAGVDVEIKPGVGPVMGSAVRTADDVARLRDLGPLTPEALQPVSRGRRADRRGAGRDAAHRLRGRAVHARRLPGRGRTVARPPGRPHAHARRPEPRGRALTEWAADVTGAFLRAQVLAGASATQLFDSWAGSLGLADYTAHVAPASARALGARAGPGRAQGALRHRHERAARRHARRRRGRHRRRLPAARSTRRTAGSAAPRRCRATSTPPCWPRPGRCSRRTSATSSPAGRPRPATW